MSRAGRGMDTALTALFLLGFYLHADLVLSDGVKVPAVGALAGGGGLLALHLGRLRHGDLLFAGAWIILAAASLLLNPALWAPGLWATFGSEFATSFLVFLASLAMALGVLAGLRRRSAAGLARLALAALLAILAGAAAERWLGLGAVSDAVRTALYPEAITYAADTRDRLLYGGVRPKLFASEPSHVAKFYVLMLLVWYATARSSWRGAGLYALLAGGVLVVQSPTVLVALPAAWIADLCRSRGALTWVLAATAALVLAPLAVVAGEALFAGRLDHILTGQDTSYLIRIVLPFEVLGRVWSDYPLFGLGFGAKESGLPYAIAAAQHLGLDTGTLIATTSPLGNNGLAIGLIQLGVVGSLAFAASLMAFWRYACGGHWPFAAAGMLGYLLLIGGINDPRFWGGLALLTAAGAVAERAATARLTPPPRRS
ncbi:MAG: hypothetical protein KDC18_10535 [Alphaproteobacteria bacterium]|nr:hypothetical protein [Alphaproteobacteria bacterium]MCB9930900.1 hypothetical protein [Alphaproteobacteria bacterium]